MQLTENGQGLGQIACKTCEGLNKNPYHGSQDGVLVADVLSTLSPLGRSGLGFLPSEIISNNRKVSASYWYYSNNNNSNC